MRFLIIFFLMASSVWADAASEPAVQVAVDKKVIFIGDRIRYEIKVASDKATEVELPKFTEGKIGSFEIKDSGTKIEKGLFGKETLRSWYYITAYSPGGYIIPQAEIKYRQRGKTEWAGKKTQPINIAVQSILPKGEKISDIKDIKGPISFWEINWLGVLGIGLILVSCAFLLASYIKRKRKISVRLPHETALEELEAIRANFARTSDVKEYYVGMSDCVRHYIERVFKLKAPEMTTEEFLNSLKDSSALSLDHKDLLKEFLNACDMVKFAKYMPTGSEIESLYTTSKRFIEETKRIFMTEAQSSRRKA